MTTTYRVSCLSDYQTTYCEKPSKHQAARHRKMVVVSMMNVLFFSAFRPSHHHKKKLSCTDAIIKLCLQYVFMDEEFQMLAPVGPVYC